MKIKLDIEEVLDMVLAINLDMKPEEYNKLVEKIAATMDKEAKRFIRIKNKAADLGISIKL